MNVAPGVLCYVQLTQETEFNAQVNGKTVVALGRTPNGNWAIEPHLRIVSSTVWQDLRGQVFGAGPRFIAALPEGSLIPIAGPGGPAVDEEREIERTDGVPA